MYRLTQSFIHSGHYYSASSSLLLAYSEGLPTQHGYCAGVSRCHTCFNLDDLNLKRHRQLRVKDLPKVHTWRLEQDSNPQPSGRKASTLPMHHHVQRIDTIQYNTIRAVAARNGAPSEHYVQGPLQCVNWYTHCAVCIFSDPRQGK